MSFSISRPGTLGGYNNTNMGFDYMPRAPQHMHAYFSTPRNPRGVVSQEQFLQKVAQAPQPAKEPEIKINSGMKIPPLAADMLKQDVSKSSNNAPPVTKSVAKNTPVSDDDSEDETLNIVAKGPNLSQLLREHQLLIKYFLSCQICGSFRNIRRRPLLAPSPCCKHLPLLITIVFRLWLSL